MKTISLDKSPGAARELKAATKNGYILLTHKGKPIAYFLPTQFYDEEDIGYMTDPEFWKMIRARREESGPSIPWEQVKAKLAARDVTERKAKTNSKNGRKGRRNGTARS